MILARRALAALLVAAPWGFSLGALVIVLLTNPFAAPLVDRAEAEVQRALTRALADVATPDTLAAQVQQALEADDLIALETLLTLADDRQIALPPDLRAQADTALGRGASWTAAAQDCGACALDPASCHTLRQMGICALPVELTPVGDLNALRRQGLAYAAGAEVDQIEVALACVGLAATAGMLVTGGASGTLKAAATVTRVARRAGTLSPRMTRALRQAADVPFRWDRLDDLALGRVGLDQVTDLRKLGALADLIGDGGRIARQTSVTDAIALLRHADTPQDIARLARVSRALGPETRGAMQVLGKSRAFRALVRLSDQAVLAGLALFAAVTQITMALASWAGARMVRPILRHAARRLWATGSA